MEWLIGATGVLVVVGVLVDIVNTLVHPGARGLLSRTLLATIWRLSRNRNLPGPMAMGVVVFTWGSLAVLGWALIYWPELPEGFGGVPVNHPERDGAWLDAVSISLVTISTLGLGDVYPTSDLMRIVNPIQGLFGFGLLTAVVSWVLEVYPTLTRRKAFAIRLTLLRDADSVRAVGELAAPAASRLLDNVGTSVVIARVDLSDAPETYYFREDEPSTSLAANVSYAADLGRAGAASPHAEVRHAARVLLGALEDLAAVLDERFLRTGGDMSDVFAAYAIDHRQGILSSGTAGGGA